MEFKKIKIKDIGRVVTGCTPKTKQKEYYEANDYMFISPTDIKNKKYIRNSEKYVSSNAYNDYKSRFIDKDSIIIDCIGSDMGNAAITTNLSLTNQQINAITRIDKCKYNIECVFYVLSTMKKYFHQIGTNGSTMPIISKSLFEEIEISLPDKSIQDKIAIILSKIDDKIEENAATNNNLLEISKQLYKRWFVDFEFPNEEGNSYKSSGGKMIESEVGEIPIDWSVKKIEDLDLDISDGNYSSKYPTKKEFIDKGIPFIRGTDFKGLSISRGGLMYISPEKHKELKKGHLKENDILITTRGEIGQIAFVPNYFIDANINAQLVRINGKSKYPKSYIGNALLSQKIQNDIKSLITGSALQQLPVGKLKQIKLIIPNNFKIISDFDEIVGRILEKIDRLEDENQNLEQLRDTLLPKLMNGEIDLENIEI